MNDAHASAVQRVENGAIAVAIIVVVVLAGLPWWVLLATFLLFDLSALGYARGPKLGALTYNIVHNYTAPAAIAVAYAAVRAAGLELDWLALLAASWGFSRGRRSRSRLRPQTVTLHRDSPRPHRPRFSAPRGALADS